MESKTITVSYDESSTNINTLAAAIGGVIAASKYPGKNVQVTVEVVRKSDEKAKSPRKILRSLLNPVVFFL